MEVGDQFHNPVALPTERKPLSHLRRRGMCQRVSLGVKRILPLARIEPQFLKPVA
jgi:hypothetical protein